MLQMTYRDRRKEHRSAADHGRHHRDNARVETIPDRLRALMELWRYQSPWLHEEFDRDEEVFPSASYQYVLYGMGARTAVLPGTLERDATLAHRAIRETRAQTQRMTGSLPGHRDLIERIVRHGLQPI